MNLQAVAKRLRGSIFDLRSSLLVHLLCRCSVETHPCSFRFSTAWMLAAVVLLAGCSIQPWVRPYERERLADPTMQFSRDPLSDKHREHVYDVREAAHGATGVQGGGCGCN